MEFPPAQHFCPSVTIPEVPQVFSQDAFDKNSAEGSLPRAYPSGESGEVCWVPSGAEGQAGDSILFSPNARLTRKIRERPGAAQTNPKFLSSSRPGHVG